MHMRGRRKEGVGGKKEEKEGERESAEEMINNTTASLCLSRSLPLKRCSF